MSTNASPAHQKSTNVRPVPRLIGLRAAFGVLDRVAPSLGGRWAARLWCTLPRPKGQVRRGPAGRGPLPVPGLHSPPITTTSIMTPAGRRVSVETWGSGPPVYLVHGWGGWRRQLDAFVEPLVQAGFSVVAHDAPSHGDSGPGDFGPRRTHGGEMMDALSGVVDTFGRPHAIVAHSLGCAITAFAIADGLPAPERLGFVAPSVGPLPHIHAMTRLLGVTERTESAMLRRVETMVGRPITDFDALTLREPMPPTLIVHDFRDKEVPHAEATTLATTWPSADLHSTDGLGHRRILRDLEVIKRIAEFVSKETIR
jgi:predicted alpha/beta hydrolase family esterase